MDVRLMLKLRSNAHGTEPRATWEVREVLERLGVTLLETRPDGLLLSVPSSTDLEYLAEAVVSATGADSAQWKTPDGELDPRGAAGPGYSCRTCGGVDGDHFAGCPEAHQ